MFPVVYKREQKSDYFSLLVSRLRCGGPCTSVPDPSLPLSWELPWPTREDNDIYSDYKAIMCFFVTILPVFLAFCFKSLQRARGHSFRALLALHICQFKTRFASNVKSLPEGSSKQSTKAWEKNRKRRLSYGQERLRKKWWPKHRSSRRWGPLRLGGWVPARSWRKIKDEDARIIGSDPHNRNSPV